MSAVLVPPSSESFAPSLDTGARSYTSEGRDNDKRLIKIHLVKVLTESGYAEVAEKVSICNSEYFALACVNGHFAQSLPTFRRRNRLCPYCAAERQRRAYRKLSPILEAFARIHPRDQPVLITLTVRNSFDPLAAQDKDFKAALRRLRRSKHWKEKIRGAVCGYEFTLTPTGWHYHVHILAFRKAWYVQAELAHDWANATRGNGQIADIRKVSNLRNGFREVLSYCFKPADLDKWTVNEVQQFQSMRRTKLSECFGGLRALKLDNDDSESPSARSDVQLFVGCPCPECGEPLQKMKLSWREFYSYAPILKDSFVTTRAGPELVH